MREKAIANITRRSADVKGSAIFLVNDVHGWTARDVVKVAKLQRLLASEHRWRRRRSIASQSRWGPWFLETRTAVLIHGLVVSQVLPGRRTCTFSTCPTTLVALKLFS